MPFHDFETGIDPGAVGRHPAHRQIYMLKEPHAAGTQVVQPWPSSEIQAEDFSLKEGVSLNQFINVAVAEKIVHLQHDEWLATRPKPTAARIARALAILDRPTQNATDPGDELPDGYVSIRDTDEYKQALGAK